MCIHIYIYMHMYISKHVCIHTYVCMYECIQVDLNRERYLYTICMNLFIYSDIWKKRYLDIDIY